MKIITFEDKDAAALLDQLKLEKMQIGETERVQSLFEKSQPQSSTPTIHSQFLYIVTRWLQEQGATVTR